MKKRKPFLVRLLIWLLSIILTLVLIVAVCCIYVNKKYGINLFETYAQVKKLSTPVNEDTKFTNKFIIPLLVIGTLLFLLKYPNDSLGQILMIISGSLFGLHVLRLIILIPLEYDASRRALKYLKENEFVSPNEYRKAKKLLGIAAQTYIVALFDDLFILNKKRKK